MCFPATNGNKGVLKRAEEYGAGGPISCQLHWRNWHYSSFLIDYDDDGRADNDRDDTVLLQPNVFANKCTKSECIIIAASLHQKTQSNDVLVQFGYGASESGMPVHTTACFLWLKSCQHFFSKALNL